MRPAVSTNFLSPVKNGWHFEQISTRMFFFVERVWMTSPQAQVIVVSSYLGWISDFIFFSFNDGVIYGAKANVNQSRNKSAPASHS